MDNLLKKTIKGELDNWISFGKPQFEIDRVEREVDRSHELFTHNKEKWSYMSSQEWFAYMRYLKMYLNLMLVCVYVGANDLSEDEFDSMWVHVDKGRVFDSYEAYG